MVSMAEGQDCVWMLGRPFEAINPDFIKQVKNIIWCTYRSGFEAINGTGFTSDAGWGCMIRTGQMIVAEALQRAGKPFPEVVRLFADANDAPLSLHKISTIGNGMGKDVGQWHTPSITAQSLHRLIAEDGLGIVSIIAQDLQLSRAELCDKVAAGPCLVWLPMRLGINELNPIYVDLIKKLLQCPLSLGIGGGRPKSSYYFFGYAGDDLLYLDPHITRPVVGDLESTESFCSYQGDSAKKMPITAIDPCFVAAFILRNGDDLSQFDHFLAELKDPTGCNLVILGEGQKDITLMDCEDDSDFVDIS